MFQKKWEKPELTKVEQEIQDNEFKIAFSEAEEAEEAEQSAKLAANKKKNQAIRAANSANAKTAKDAKPAKPPANKKYAAARRAAMNAESDLE